MEKSNEVTIVCISPFRLDSAGDIVRIIEEKEFMVVDMRTISLDEESDLMKASSIFHLAPARLKENGKHMIAVSFSGKKSIHGVHELVQSWENSYRNDVVCARNTDEVTKLSLFANQERKSSATFSKCTCCIIKPHIVKSRQVGAVIDHILSQNFEISAIKLCQLDKSTATEFFKVYQGVWKEYIHIIDSFCAGPSISLEVKQENDVVNEFRLAAGPWNVDVARELYPNSIRGLFGKNRVENAVHCTDLLEDAAHEIKYFFSVL